MTGPGLHRLATACAAALALSAQPGAMAQGRAALEPPPLAPAPPPSQARAPIPEGITVWARLIQQNYPPEAARLMQEGRVWVRVIVNPQGWVTDCVVVQSSGHEVLDTAACDAMRRYAVFHPATDADGRPTVGTFATVITYKAKDSPPSAAEAPAYAAPQPSADAPKARALAPRYRDLWAARIKEDYPREAALQSLEGPVVVRASVNPEGLVDDCQVVISSTHEILDQAACLSMRRYARFYPALDAEGRPTWGLYTTLIEYRLDQPVPPPAASPPAAAEGGTAGL